ncbi:glycosyltransferase family 4 protein [Sphingomonas naphthae]|uniref:Glycosyltransferase family 4 protein n=1 Tax=Sphingomonas naphthae TaxID=1813468 RepID=A0ABY7TLA0_9SPHN|nr:glycosyltransferase family 4 protein [Sphingomonas naphthae]WCT73482.1 glycosyltransferase family 4 protein [Sphingomonas naphthae]
MADKGAPAPRRYIAAHNRDRDFYQLAVALAEKDALFRLITDYHIDEGSLAYRALLRRVIRNRATSPLDRTLIDNDWAAVAWQMAATRLFPADYDWGNRCDKILAAHVRRLARRNPSVGLFLYHNLAFEAFTDPALADRAKALFVFHPHSRYNHAILKADYDLYGIGAYSLTEEAPVSERMDRLDTEIALADHVLCASSFTARSIAASNVNHRPVTVVPYGAVPGRSAYRPREGDAGPVRFLFVGQAVQRKGIHHLLKVWRGLPTAGIELTLVCSNDRENILHDLPPNVIVKSHLPIDALIREFQTAHCFLLPALVEGFGLVLLEALQAGCYTIFSDATGLADCAVPDYAGQEVAAGDLDGLAAAIEQAVDRVATGRVDHRAIADFADTLSADAFRRGIQAVLETL